MDRTLAPKSLEGILKETFTVYKRNFLRLTAIAAIVMVSTVIVSFIVGFGGGLLSRSVWVETGALPSITPIINYTHNSTTSAVVKPFHPNNNFTLTNFGNL